MQSIGKYKLLDQMGAGAVGITYRASDSFRNREMVVKVLNPAITGTPELREQISRELSAAADLRHPHIVKVRDLGEVEDTIYVATEFLNGVDLRWHIERRILTLADKIDLMVQICGALAFAHTKGIPHGNIKPSNIFVTDKDATLLDLGIGKCLASIVDAGGRPAALQPNYFAPEQILGKPISARSDVFSIGVLLYELLARYPFTTDVNLMPREIVHSSPEPLRNLDPQIPEELDQLIIRAMEKDPEKRLARVDELAAGLYLISQKLSGPAAPKVEARPLVSEAVHEAASEQPKVDLAPPAFAPMVVVPPVAPPPAPKPTVLIVPPPPPQAETAPPVLPGSNVQAMPAPVGQMKAPPKKPVRPRLWWAPYVAAGILTFVISLAFLSRQNIRASQTKAAAPGGSHAAAPAEAVKPAPAPALQQPVVSTPAVSEAPAAPGPASNEPAAAKSNSAQLMAQVKYLWSTGKYAQALEKVDAILGDDPDNLEGRLWKKKIRAAQEAEAAIK